MLNLNISLNVYVYLCMFLYMMCTKKKLMIKEKCINSAIHNNV
jgi:hypothetical protein